MAEKGLGSVILSAGLGAMATVAGLYVAKKIKHYLSRKPKMKLFHKHMCLSTRCAWLISELGAESDFELTEDLPDMADGQESSQELLLLQQKSLTENHQNDIMPLVAFNPNQKDVDEDSYSYDLDYPDDSTMSSFSNQSSISAVVLNDEFTMIEGAAICMYLADLYGQFLPDPEHKAEYYSWIVYSAATFDNIIKTLHHQLVDLSENGRDNAIVESATNGFHAFARALSESLEKRDFLCGKRFTAADCVIGFTLWWTYTINSGRLFKDHPILLSYLKRLRDRPAFKKTFGADPESWDWSQYFSAYVHGVQGLTE